MTAATSVNPHTPGTPFPPGPASLERTIGVAIPVPAPYGEALQTWRMRFGDPQALAIPAHVTLLGPSTVTDDELPVVTAHLYDVAAAAEPFDLHLRGTGTFRPLSDVVFVALAEGISSCERLERRVRSGPLHRPSRFVYHPHVTIAHDLAPHVLDAVFNRLADFEAQFSVRAFSLFEHGTDGVWRPSVEFPFGAAAG